MGLFRLKEHTFVILRYISTKLFDTIYILSFKQFYKVSCKSLHALLKYRQKSRRESYFIISMSLRQERKQTVCPRSESTRGTGGGELACGTGWGVEPARGRRVLRCSLLGKQTAYNSDCIQFLRVRNCRI